MRMIIKVLWVVLFVGIGGGAIALATWGIPAPSTIVTETITPKDFHK